MARGRYNGRFLNIIEKFGSLITQRHHYRLVRDNRLGAPRLRVNMRRNEHYHYLFSLYSSQSD